MDERLRLKECSLNLTTLQTGKIKFCLIWCSVPSNAVIVYFNREISMLIKSDGHPNVVRYFVKEERIDFVYLGLQLCQCSLK